MTDSRQDITPITLDLTTGAGVEYTLHEPSMVDIVEGEKMLGKPFFKWFSEETGISFDVFGTAIWLAARKHGLTPEAIKDKRWPFTCEELMASLTLNDCYRNLKAVAGFFTPPLGEADPPEATSSEGSESVSEPGKS